MKNESCAAMKAMLQLLARVTQKHHIDLLTELMVGMNSFHQRPALICISMRHELYFAVCVYRPRLLCVCAEEREGMSDVSAQVVNGKCDSDKSSRLLNQLTT